jgi:tetratricopeptide (TPR) repeat protein
MADSPADQIEVLLRKHADNPEGRYFVPLANNYRKLGELDEAERYLREGLKKHPDYLSAHIVLAQCLADRGASGPAAAEFRHVLAIDPHNLIALRTLGDIARATGDADEARRWYSELLAIDPMSEDVRHALDALDAAADVDFAGGEDAEFEADGGWWAAPAPGDAEAGGPRDEQPAPGRWDSAAWSDGDEVSFESEPLMDLDLSSLDLGDDADDEPEPFDTSDLGFEAARTAPEALVPGWPEGESDDAPGESAVANFDGLLETPAEPGVSDARAPSDDDGEVVTETIAELYATQGFHDRAADVYRRLIERNGETAWLSGRLREMERLASGQVDPTPPRPSLVDVQADPEMEPGLVPWQGGDDAAGGWLPAAHAPTPEAEEPVSPFRAGEDASVESADAFALSFAHGFAGLSGNGNGSAQADAGAELEPARDSEPSLDVVEPAMPQDGPAAASFGLDAEFEVPAVAFGQEHAAPPAAVGGPDAGAGAEAPTVGAFFASLLGWAPAAAQPAVTPPSTGRAAPEPSEPMPAEPAEEPGDDTDWQAPWGVDAAVDGDIGSAPVDEETAGEEIVAIESPGLDATDEPMPWEVADETTASVPAPQEPADAGVADQPAIDPFSFDDLFVDSEAAPSGADAKAAAPSPERDVAAANDASSSDDDEDLESFQAWLRSLKR